MIQKETKVLLNHFLHLSFLRGISRILPFITTPFLIKTIGIEEFGLLEFSKAISSYFSSFISYGFNFSATQQISINQTDKITIGQIVSSVYTIKLFIIFICLLIIVILINFIPKIRAESLYLISFFPVVIASSLFPTFAFQGLNKMHWLTGINLVCKVLFLGSLFIFIHSPADALKFPLLLGLVDLLRLIVAFFILHRVKAIPLQYPVWAIIKQQIKEGFHIFLSQIISMFYSHFSILFLGFLGSPTMVTLYSVGDKIARITEVVLDAFMQALYPLAHQKVDSNLQEGSKYIINFAKIGTLILVIAGINYWLFATPLIHFLTGGTELPKAVSILRIHAFLPVFIFLSNLFGIGILVPLKLGKKYTITIALTGFLAAGLHCIFVPLFKAEGAAWAVLISRIGTVIILGSYTYQIVNNKNSYLKK